MTSNYKISDAEAALEIAKNLEKKGYKVVNIKSIEADIAWFRRQGHVKR